MYPSEGSDSSSFGGAVHYPDCHRPAAPLATWPPDQPSVPVSPPGRSLAGPFASTPCKLLPVSGQGPLILTSRCDVRLGHSSSCSVCRGKEKWAEWGWGSQGLSQRPGSPSVPEAESSVRWGAVAVSRLECPGAGRCLLAQGDASLHVAGRGFATVDALV